MDYPELAQGLVGFFSSFICFYFTRRLRLEIEVNMVSSDFLHDFLNRSLIDSQLTTTNLREELSLMCKMSSWPLEAEALEYCLFMAASVFIVHKGRF